MKRSLFLAVCSISALRFITAAKADTIADWTFETSHPNTLKTGGVWLTNIVPEIGTGTASAHEIGTAIYASPIGNGSAHSFAMTNATTGDFYQFAVSTVGYENISQPSHRI